MSGPEFFQTMMGKKFYEGTMPRIATALEKLTKALEEEDATEPSEFKDPIVRLKIPDTDLMVCVTLEGEGVRIDVVNVNDKGIAQKWRTYDDMALGNPDLREDLDVFTMTDQPEECRKCGTRTEFEDVTETDGEILFQVHECPKCHYVYKLVEDEDDNL